MKYFAYGANMLTRRLKADKRAPSAILVGTGYIAGHRLSFDKQSKDCSGKCDAEVTGNKADRVYGVIFEISCTDKCDLDKSEGLGDGYKEEPVEVITTEAIIPAYTYIATRKKRKLRPYHWYKAIVVSGAVKHNLPAEYIEWLRTFESISDPDVKRREENERQLFAS